MMNPRRLRECERLLIALLISALSFGCAGAKELNDFHSDGCSLFPDRSLISKEDWCLCCFEHDLLYWQGGTAAERRTADEVFKDCILRQTGDAALARLMYAGVRFGGSPYFYTWYRWGYGWGYERKYAPLSEEEKAQVAEKLNRYYANPPAHPCP